MSRSPLEVHLIDQQSAAVREYLDGFDRKSLEILARHPDAVTFGRAILLDLMMHTKDPVEHFARLIAWDEILSSL